MSRFSFNHIVPKSNTEMNPLWKKRIDSDLGPEEKLLLTPEAMSSYYSFNTNTYTCNQTFVSKSPCLEII